MPKVSSAVIKINEKEISSTYNVDVIYNSTVLFYIVVPEEFNEQFDHVTDEELAESSAKKLYKRKSHFGPFLRVICSATEAGCVENAKAFFKKLILLSVVKRDVIIVRVNDDDYTLEKLKNGENDFGYMEVSMHMQYCLETKAGVKVQYRMWRDSGDDSDPDRTYTEVRMGRENTIVIDDTPENRLYLEGIYKKLIMLQQHLKQFIAAPEKLLEDISSNQKLLNEADYGNLSKSQL